MPRKAKVVTAVTPAKRVGKVAQRYHHEELVMEQVLLKQYGWNIAMVSDFLKQLRKESAK